MGVRGAPGAAPTDAIVKFLKERLGTEGWAELVKLAGGGNGDDDPYNDDGLYPAGSGGGPQKPRDVAEDEARFRAMYPGARSLKHWP